jgi:hypothetical protein
MVRVVTIKSCVKNPTGYAIIKAVKFEIQTNDISNPVNTINPPESCEKLENTRKNTIAGSTNRSISFIAKLVVSNIDFKDSGKKDPSKKALRITRVSFAGKLKKNLLKFVNVASLD